MANGMSGQERTYKRDLATKSWEFIYNNYHKLSEDNKVKIAIALVKHYKKPNSIIVNGRENSPELHKWRTAVFARDGYTCQVCGAHGVELNAHHIKSWANHPELRLDLDNGQTLCVKCHRNTENYGNRINQRFDCKTSMTTQEYNGVC